MTWHYFVAGLLPIIIGYRNIRKKQKMKNNLQFCRFGNMQIHFSSMLARICRTRSGALLPQKIKSRGHDEMIYVEYYFIRRNSDGKWEGRLSQESWDKRREYAQFLFEEEKERHEADKELKGVFSNPNSGTLANNLAQVGDDSVITNNIAWHPLEKDNFPVPLIETAYQKYIHTQDIHPLSFYWHEYNENWFLENFYFNNDKAIWYKNIIFCYVSAKIKSHNQRGFLYQFILA